MNILNSFRSSLRYTKNLEFNSIKHFCSSTSSVLPQENHVPAESEIDKLYKLLEIELRGNEPAVLRSYIKFATTAGNHLNIESKAWSLHKPVHNRHTVLKAIHVNKKHRVQYEFRTYFSFIQYKYLTGSTADTLLEYIERNLPEGVSLKATKIELQKIPNHMYPPQDPTEVPKLT